MSAPDLVKLMEHAAGLLHADEGRHLPVTFTALLGDGEAQLTARLVWRLFEPGPRVVVADVDTGRALCESLPGRPYDLDRHDDDTQPGAPARPAARGAEAVFPDYMAHLVDRAASRLKAEGWCQSVAFTWWADGEATAYTARMDWAPGELAPRVVVFDARSGDFVCQSLKGELYEIDPLTWCVDVAPDVVAEYEHQQRTARQACRCGRGAAA